MGIRYVFGKSTVVHVVRASCGYYDTGDELDLPEFQSRDENEARATFEKYRDRCLEHLEKQAAIVESSPGLRWDGPNFYSVIWLAIPSEWFPNSMTLPEALIERIDGDEDLTDLLAGFVRRVAGGASDGNGLREYPPNDAAVDAIEQLLSSAG